MSLPRHTSRGEYHVGFSELTLSSQTPEGRYASYPMYARQPTPHSLPPSRGVPNFWNLRDHHDHPIPSSSQLLNSQTPQAPSQSSVSWRGKPPIFGGKDGVEENVSSVNCAVSEKQTRKVSHDNDALFRTRRAGLLPSNFYHLKKNNTEKWQDNQEI